MHLEERIKQAMKVTMNALNPQWSSACSFSDSGTKLIVSVHVPVPISGYQDPRGKDVPESRVLASPEDTAISLHKVLAGFYSVILYDVLRTYCDARAMHWEWVTSLMKMLCDIACCLPLWHVDQQSSAHQRRHLHHGWLPAEDSHW